MIKNINFKDIENEDFKPNILTRYDIKWEGVNFQFLIKYVPNSKKVVVFSNGAIRAGFDFSKLPVYSRSAYANDIPYTCIYCFDPTVYMYDNLLLGWGYGKENRFILENSAYLLLQILTKQNISLKDVLYMGSSGGGFQSILLATMLRGKAFAINPQLILTDYFGGRPLIDHVNDLILSRINCVEFFFRERFMPDLHIKINSTDTTHLLAYSRFIKDIVEKQIYFGENLRSSFYCREGGHSAMVERPVEISWIIDDIEKEMIQEDISFKKKYKIKPFLQRVKEGYVPFIDSTLERETVPEDYIENEEDNVNINDIIAEFEKEIYNNTTEKENIDKKAEENIKKDEINILAENKEEKSDTSAEVDKIEEKKENDSLIWNMVPNEIGQGNIDFVYSTTVFLDYIKNFETSHHFLQPTYFKDELKIANIGKFQNKLVRMKLIEIVNDNTRRLTSNGIEFLNKHKDYVFLFNLSLPLITVSEYEDVKSKMKGESFKNILISLIKDKIKKSKNLKQWDVVNKLYFELAKIYKNVELYSESLYNYITVLYYQISGKEYYNYIEKCFSNELGVQQTRDMWKGLYIQNEVVRAVKELKDEFEECFIDEIYENNELKIHLFTKEKFKLFINSILEDEFEDSYWQGELHKAYYHIFDEISNRK